MIENRDTTRRDRDTEVVEEKGYGENPPFQPTIGLGSTISRTPAKNGLHFELERMHLTSDDNKFGIGMWPIGINTVNVTLHYIQSGTKLGQGLEFWTIRHPRRHRNFPGRGCHNPGLSW